MRLKYIFSSLFFVFISYAQKSEALSQERFVSDGKMYAALFQQ